MCIYCIAGNFRGKFSRRPENLIFHVFLNFVTSTGSQPNTHNVVSFWRGHQANTLWASHTFRTSSWLCIYKLQLSRCLLQREHHGCCHSLLHVSSPWITRGRNDFQNNSFYFVPTYSPRPLQCKAYFAELGLETGPYGHIKDPCSLALYMWWKILVCIKFCDSTSSMKIKCRTQWKLPAIR